MNFAVKKTAVLLLAVMVFTGCKKDRHDKYIEETDPEIFTPGSFNIDNLTDTYGAVASLTFYKKWGPYNLHDPSIIKAGEWFYCYSTDVAYGFAPRPGIMVRRSRDLVDWQYVGWALSGLPQMGVKYIKDNGGTPVKGLWAPFIMKAGNEFRLYYSLAPTSGRTSCIGLLTANSPEGPWVEKGLTVTSINTGPGTNAIDPSVVVTPSGEHWMVYGSSWDGLYQLKLNPATGLAMTSGDKGTRIVRRGWTGGKVNGNLEGPEIIYNPETDYYYLFTAYDWLSTKYNVRVFRSKTPNGPFHDWNGVNVDDPEDNGPMILAPYKFINHSGWAGVAHCAVFKDGNQYFMAHQGRPGVDRNFMVMHVRKIFWTSDGWPVVSPERYAAVENNPVKADEITGNYEQIVLGYQIVPGFDAEQTDPQYNEAFAATLDADGKINGDPANTWTYNAPWIELRWANGLFVDKLHVSRERDWERKKVSTIVMTGLNQDGLAIWLKKVP